MQYRFHANVQKHQTIEQQITGPAEGNIATEKTLTIAFEGFKSREIALNTCSIA